MIFMIIRACDFNLVMISSLASKGQDVKSRGLQFHFVAENGHPNFKILKQVKISWPNLNHKLFISQESNIEKLLGVTTCPPELRHFIS